ncbi:type II toxin-antitoxin system HipA family toxin [Myroides marinus]|uniref:type II toxin-antitoxin system HipA family toxin n=1 Tax=Myroides marinus TaxID=703342 RepID=UPI00257535D2|nr:type II toxin-antitoxin system HipA family toxin [Myroides marinus]MDM1346466.1 type II toxin-antitoxin system HipA family toxin [Myroides marinus]MDM1349885.1 type II toxin-antitoxin system HipA family toxin [Myroides marinus]MDM1357093.1 type II toxin-antitoxin system HipA family toxin [Myroides marinus]MDM1376519.1 type II toxin-antitoxin system HipA family toxin [Myroides marinus]MDM1378629.1 type II toxin-antitoxin system HipA family toxin [Myroides marinus]
MAKNQIISVYYQSIEVGKLGYDEDKRKASFQYNPKFVDDSFKNLFPFLIRKTKNVQLFDQYSGETFRGLPPVIADSLPDMFGNIVFKEWLEANNKEMSSISPLEQLTYVGCRGMGALEYMPVKEVGNVNTIDIQEITDVVKKVMDLKTSISEKGLSDSALLNIFKIGTSAGGAHPKILVAEHKITGELIPGDRVVSEEYHHYLIKLDIDEKAHYSKQKIEYVYYQIATNIGIEMMPSKLVDDKHFAAHRFDRQKGEKQHVLTASGMTGWDFTKPDNSSYNNLFKLALALKLPHKDIQMLFKRMVFNIVFANIDDHLKNFSFIYNNLEDRWNLAPAYDLTYPLDALLNYTRVSRAMSVNGKRTDITREDLMLIAEEFSIKEADKTIEQVNNATALFSLYSAKLQIPNKVIDLINKAFIIL